MRRSELVTVPFFSPGQRRKANVGELSGIRLSGDIRDDHQRTAGQRTAHRVAVGERHHRVGAHDPHRFHLAAADGGKQLHGGQPRGLRQPLGSPKRASRCRSSGTKSMCAASIVANPPTSRPPMALG